MKKLLSLFCLLFAITANAQTFTVQNLQVNGTTNLTGALTGSSGSFTGAVSGTSATFTGPNTFTGATTAVTQGFLDNSTLVATDAFAKQEILAATAEIPISNFTGGTYNFATAGTGAQLVIFATGGTVQSIVAIAAPGSGYQVGDCLILVGGNGDGIARVTTLSGSGVATASVLYGGTGYTTGATLIGSPLPPGSRTANLNGVLASNAVVIIPAGTFLQGARRVSFSNNTTGAFTVQVKLSNGSGGSTGTGVFLPQGTANSSSILLYTDGVTDVWPEVSLTGLGAGTVTSVQVSGGTTGLTFSGGPITSSGTITEAGTLAIANGGTNAITKAAAFNNLAPMTTTGDTIYEASAGTAARLAVGTTGQVYTVVAGIPAWAPPPAGVSVVNGFINGFTLANDGTSPNTVLDEAAGYAADSTNAVMITGTAFTKSTAGTWVAGTGNNGMGTGLTIAASTWYHVFAIVNAGSYDVYYDTSPTAANKPAGTTAFRYVGSFKTNASSQIIAFLQTGQTFQWASPILDLSSGTATSFTPVTLSTPLGFVTYPLLRIQFVSVSVAGLAELSNQTSGNLNVVLVNPVANQGAYASAQMITNTSSQIEYLGTGTSPATSISTNGYVNPHVAPNF